MDRGAEGQTVPCAPARWAGMVDSMLEQPRVQKNEDEDEAFEDLEE